MGILLHRLAQNGAVEVEDLMRSMRTARESMLDSDPIQHCPFEGRQVLRRPDTPPPCQMTSTF
jgi:hypothetical protein